jgi:hypothetical protein
MLSSLAFAPVFAIRYETRSRRVMSLVGTATRFQYLFGYREEPFVRFAPEPPSD